MEINSTEWTSVAWKGLLCMCVSVEVSLHVYCRRHQSSLASTMVWSTVLEILSTLNRGEFRIKPGPHYGCMQAAYDRQSPACRRRQPGIFGVEAGMQIVIIRHE